MKKAKRQKKASDLPDDQLVYNQTLKTEENEATKVSLENMDEKRKQAVSARGKKR